MPPSWSGRKEGDTAAGLLVNCRHVPLPYAAKSIQAGKRALDCCPLFARVRPTHMTDRIESLLAELVELHRRQISNQEQALARQEHAISIQQQAVARQRTALRRIWLLVAVVMILIGGELLFTWVVSLRR